MDYMIFDSTGNALGAYEDEIVAHAALREIAELHPEAADVALLTYADGMPLGDALRPIDLPVGTSSVDLAGWAGATGRTCAVVAWRQEVVYSFWARRIGQVPSAAGVAAAPDWEERLEDLAV